MRNRFFLFLPALAVVAACSNSGSIMVSDPRAEYEAAASEEAVDLQPGLYEIRLGGSTVVELRSGTRTDELCLNSYDCSQFPKDPLGPIVERWPTCSNRLDPPRGNAMSGARKCEKRRMPMTASYNGTHTANSFKIEGIVSQGTGENESVMHLGSGNFSITGKRVADCSF